MNPSEALGFCSGVEHQHLLHQSFRAPLSHARLWPGHAAVWHSLPQKLTPRHPVQRLLAPVLPQKAQVLIPTEARAALMFSRLSMVVDFGDSIRKNLYLKTLTIRGVDLGNTFLEALASAIRDNVTLKEIDLSRNSFTHDALVEFCQALELNQTITTVRLQTQMSPIYKNSIETVLEALDKNRSIKSMMIDF